MGETTVDGDGASVAGVATIHSFAMTRLPFHSWMCGFVAYNKNPDNNEQSLTHRNPDFGTSQRHA